MNEEDKKVNALLIALRTLAAQIIATIEDFLEVPYDRSTLSNRLEKARRMSPVSKARSGM